MAALRRSAPSYPSRPTIPALPPTVLPTTTVGGAWQAAHESRRRRRAAMPQEVRGVVSLKKGDPVSVETIVIPDPGPGEAVVAVQACGVCHTDLHYREGGINDEFPFLLGHEAAGIVEAVGPGVTNVSPGDFVVLNWRAVCGTCRSCRKGKPQY